MSEPRTIHLVDDDEAIRHSASFMLRHAGFVVKTYKDGLTFLQTTEPADRGCVLLDVRMPVMDGIAVLQALNERGNAMPVIVLTGHGDVTVAVNAMKAGAIDFIEKPYEKNVLVGSINQAFERIETHSGADQRTNEARALIATLTPREHEVLVRLVEGLTNKGIAEDLDISARTVEIHRANLMEKMQADSLSAALKLAFAAGIGLED